jgi:iron complex outermembrane receptor protein
MTMNKISLMLCALFSVNSAWAEHELQLREVNVSAPLEAQLLFNQMEAERSVTPGAVTVVDGESLQERNVGNLSDMLRYVPGVWATSYNGNDDVFYSSRGSNLDATDYDKNGVKFFQDGLPVTAADGNNHNRAIDALNARAIVVAHGANALAYGASTLGGAIDFITPTARTSSPFSLSLSGGSFGEQRVRATAGGVSGVLDGQFAVEAMKRDGYRDHSHQDRQSLYANVGVQMTEDVSTRFYASYADLYLELPRELTWAQYHANPRQARADAVGGNHSKAVEAWRLAFKTTVNNVAGGTLEFGASHEDQSLYHPIVGDGSGAGFSLIIDTEHKNEATMLRYHKDVGQHSLAFGANYAYSSEKGGNYANFSGNPGYLMWNSLNFSRGLELFALDRWKFAPDWTLVYGTQYVSAEREVGSVLADYHAFNPRAGVIFNLQKGAEWYANVSRVYEPPTTFEMTDELAGGGTPLKAMHGGVVETGLRGLAQAGKVRWNWDVSAYYTALRNEILSVIDSGTSKATNIDKTTHAGVEALLGASFDISGGHRIEPLVNATFNAFSFDSDPTYGNNRLPAAPRWFTRGEVMYANTSGFRIGPTFDLVGARYIDFANTQRVGSYGLFGARAEYETGQWNVFAEARNLADKDYVASVVVKDRAGAGDAVLHPGGPRSIYVGARYQF